MSDIDQKLFTEPKRKGNFERHRSICELNINMGLEELWYHCKPHYTKSEEEW
jgi:hypothetical protein